MQQNVPQTWTASLLLFTVLATGGALGTHRYCTGAHLGTLGGAIGDARAMNDATRQLMGAPARLVQRTAQRSDIGHGTLARKEGLILLMLMAQGVRPTLGR